MTRLFQILFLFSVLTGATAADVRRHGRGLIEEKKEVHQKDVRFKTPYERKTRRGL